MTGYDKIFYRIVMVLLLSPSIVYSQKPSVETLSNKKNILIGEQIKVNVKTIFPLHSTITGYSLGIPDSIPHFDIIDIGKADTIDYKDDAKAIEQTIIVTSFDSGSWVFPSLNINFKQADQQQVSKLQTDSFAIAVAYATADSTNQLRDIKPILDVTETNYTWLYITGGILILLLIIYLVWRYLKKRKRDPVTSEGSKLSPYDEAMHDLEKLSRNNLEDAAAIKLYHSSLSDIVKKYYGRKQNKNLMNKTTGDILIEITKLNLPRENISAMATVLRCNDAVKFAKYLPALVESKECLMQIKETIDLLEQLTINNKP